MPKNKISIDYSFLGKLLDNLEEAGASIKEVTETALKAGKEIVNKEAEAAMAKHKRTGRTADSIDKSDKVEWSGSTAEIDVGFHIRQGGLPSIFLMYGTPRMQPDRRLYNSIYGSSINKKVQEVQQKALEELTKKMAGG